MNYRNMEIDDYEDVYSLWQKCEGVRIREADSREGIDKYLSRNPGLSFIAEDEDEIIGAIISGHDGKRGYIHHLAVDEQFRNSGIGSKLILLCISALKVEGILKSHIHILSDNDFAKQFWSNRGWVRRNDIEVYSFINCDRENI